MPWWDAVPGDWPGPPATGRFARVGIVTSAPSIHSTHPFNLIAPWTRESSPPLAATAQPTCCSAEGGS